VTHTNEHSEAYHLPSALADGLIEEFETALATAFRAKAPISYLLLTRSLKGTAKDNCS